MRRIGATGCSLSRRRLERPHRGHGDHADRDAILRRSRRAAPHRRLPARSGPPGPTPPEHRGPHDRQTSSRRRLARAGARTAPGRQAGPFGRYWPAGPTGRWPLPAVLRRTQPGRRRPNAPECTHFAPASAEAAADAAPEPGSPGQRVPVDPVPLGKGPACGANRLPAPDTPPKMGARRSAAIRGTALCPAAPPAPPSCPMRRGVLTYHRRDDVPGQTRAQIRPPGPSAKITQGARPCDTGTHHAT
jgi:hypothetical protein